MRSILLVIFLFLQGVLFSQNLIQNGGFENFSALPNDISQINKAIPWRPVSITADYFHADGIYNIDAHTGQGYGGMGAWVDDPPEWPTHESIGQELVQPLEAGKNYWFKLYSTQAIFLGSSCVNIQVYGFNFLPTMPFSPENYVGNHALGTYLGETDNIITVDNWLAYEFCFVSPGDFSHLVLSVSDENCNAYLYMDDIELYELEDLKLFPPSVGLCDEEVIELGVDVNGAEYVWQDGSTSPFYEVSEPGEYWVSIDTVCNLMLADTIQVIDDRLFLEDDFLGPDTVFCHDDIISISVPEVPEGANFLWSTGETEQSIIPNESGIYEVEVVKNECVNSDFINVEIQNCTPCKVYLPNAFSPDFDGVNDVYSPLHICNVIDMRMQIYDRWGNLLFFSEDSKPKWEGTQEGKDCSQGIYTCVLEYRVEEFGEIREYLRRQDILLVR